MKKTYLGDGVYASFDGYQIRLTAEDGVRETEIIYLDSQVQDALANYIERIREADRAKGEQP
jgi:hypothetical protein